VGVDHVIPNSEQHVGRRRLKAPQRARQTPEPRVPAAIRETVVGRAGDRREQLYRTALATSDVLAALLALTVALYIVSTDTPSAALVLCLPIIVVVSKVKGLYDRDELLIRKSTVNELPQLFQLATAYTLVIWLLEDLFVVGMLGKEQVLALWGLLFAFAAAGRYVARGLVGRFAAPQRCLFIGDAGSYARLQTKLEGLPVEFVGRMSLQRVARRGGGRSNTDTRELRDMFAYTHADRVILESSVLPAEDMHDLIRAVKGSGVRVSLLPQVFDVIGTSVVMDEIQGMTLLGVRRFGLPRSSALMKRAFDLVGATIMLLAAAPVLAILALAIRLDSRGPVLFRQERVGRDGRRFRICKFRTMCVDAEERKAELRAANECEGGLFKIADDPRITRVGRILRKTSLDELPQLFNVVSGDMSLVGPRPLVVDEDEQITGLDRSRLALTPGMTGHWQILGSSRVPLPEMIKIDYLYVAGWSLWADIKILLRTIPYMLSRRGM
jgi:exopolysaccharide biosynthesis polyprenyl glycosylphosphotransferase